MQHLRADRSQDLLDAGRVHVVVDGRDRERRKVQGLRAAEVAVAPPLSRARAVSEYVPAAALLHVALYGALVSLAINVVP